MTIALKKFKNIKALGGVRLLKIHFEGFNDSKTRKLRGSNAFYGIKTYQIFVILWKQTYDRVSQL